MQIDINLELGTVGASAAAAAATAAVPSRALSHLSRIAGVGCDGRWSTQAVRSWSGGELVSCQQEQINAARSSDHTVWEGRTGKLGVRTPSVDDDDVNV